jgi:hypothetical protein
MDQAARLQVYQAQTENVRSMLTAMRQVHRSINAALRANNQPSVHAFTRVYTLLFCAWAEANFSKVLHTPHGFDLDEIAQVQVAKVLGIREAWKKSVQLGLRHLDVKRGNFLPNARKKLDAAIDAHVFDPSLLRNKLAHGQWVTALNRNNDAIQMDITNKIAKLDVVGVGGWIEGHKLLTGLVENSIESPNKTFMRDWYDHVTQLEGKMIEAEGRTLQEHVSRLLAKDDRTGASEKRKGP